MPRQASIAKPNQTTEKTKIQQSSRGQKRLTPPYDQGDKQSSSTAKTQTDQRASTRRFVPPDYTNQVLSYTCPATKRPSFGIVGKYCKTQNGYRVDFTFTDNKEPFSQVDCCPLEFVAEHLVDEAAARKWTVAVAKQSEFDSPGTKQKKKNSIAAAVGNTRKRLKTVVLQTQDNEDATLPPTSTGNPNKGIHQNTGYDSPTPSQSGRDDEDEDASKDADHEKQNITHATSTEYKKKGRKARITAAVDPAIKALIQHAVREATYDIRPSDQRTRPFMYWNGTKTTACAKMLIKRTPSLRLIAEKYARNEFATTYAGITKLAANNERSAQIRQIRKVYLNDDSDFSFITGYKFGGTSNSPTRTKDMRISSALKNEFHTIDELRECLLSPEMYNYPRLFDLFCAGLESGRIRGTKQLGRTPIEELITVAHEAHFRLELWYALAIQAYRHDPSKTARGERYDKHHTLCGFVAQERRETASNAFKHRCDNTQESDDSDADSSDDDTGVNEEFY